MKMRDDVKNQIYCPAWPPQISEEEVDSKIPTSVICFLRTLLTGTGCVNPSQSAESVVKDQSSKPPQTSCFWNTHVQILEQI